MDILQTLGNVTGFTQHNIDNQLLKNSLEAGRINENQYKRMGGYNVSQTMPQNLGLGYGDVGLASLGYQGIKGIAGGLDKLHNMTGGKIGVADTLGLSKYGDIGPWESIKLNTLGAKEGLNPYDLQTYQSIIGQYQPVGGMYPGGKHELTAPLTKFKQHQLMNKRKQNFQDIVRRKEEAAKQKAAADAAAAAKAKADAAAAQQVQQNIQTYGNQDRPNTGMNAPGGKKGQSPTGGDVEGTPFNSGGLVNFYRYGGFI